MRALKAIVLGLVLANVLYFLWPRAAPRPAQREAPAPRLRLASEAVSPGAAASAAAPPATASAPLPAPGASAPAGSALAGPAPMGSATPGSATAATAAAPAPSAATRCISIGPFLDVAEAVRAAATLRAAGYGPRQRVAEGDVWAGVWVYVDMPSTPAERARMRAQLAGAGVDDALEMPGPKGTPVMSLGLFSEAPRAEARIRVARSLGLQPATAERKRTGDVYWIDVDLKPSDPNLNAADLDGDGSRIVRLQIVGCPGT